MNRTLSLTPYLKNGFFGLDFLNASKSRGSISASVVKAPAVKIGFLPVSFETWGIKSINFYTSLTWYISSPLYVVMGFFSNKESIISRLFFFCFTVSYFDYFYFLTYISSILASYPALLAFITSIFLIGVNLGVAIAGDPTVVRLKCCMSPGSSGFY
jgi:hypothetical protein